MAEREDFCLLTSLMSLLDKIKSQQVHPNYLNLCTKYRMADCPVSKPPTPHQEGPGPGVGGVGRGRFVTTPLSPCFSQGLTSPVLQPLPAADWVLSTLAKKEDCIHLL